MRIRHQYYPCYSCSEKKFVLECLAHINSSFISRCLKKYKLNIYIFFTRLLTFFLRRALLSTGIYYYQVPEGTQYCIDIDRQVRRSLPISLSKQDVILALKNEYLDEVNKPITFSKDIAVKEHEQIKQQIRQKAKQECQYLLDLIEELKS